ncbi:MAG: deoxyribonuclease IV [Patescibacteria group bacterium]
MMKKNTPYIGGHVSTAGGISNAISHGEAIGATTIQIFGASPQTWFTKFPSEEEIKKFKEAKKKSSINSVYLHAAYLVNLASASDEIYEKSIKNLSEHLKIAESIEAEGLIFHLGSNKGISKEEGLKKEIAGMKEVLRHVPGKSFLIMENSAGGGDKIGSNIEEIGFLFKEMNSDRVKMCFDTAHAFEAGLIQEYTKENVKKLFDTWEKEIGLEYMVALHMNDSKTAYESHHDRHENIGEGHIGMEGFKVLAKEKRLFDKAWLLEVPGFDDGGPDKRNMEILKSFFE